MSPLSPLKSLSSLAVSSPPQRECRPVRQGSTARTWPHVRTSPVLLVCSCQLRLIAGFIVGSWERTHGNDLARTISGTNARCDPPDPQLPVCTPTHFMHRWWTALTRHSRTAHRMFHRMFDRTPTESPHRPKQLHAVPYPACQPATQFDLDHPSSPSSIGSHSLAPTDLPHCRTVPSRHRPLRSECKPMPSYWPTLWPMPSAVAEL